jgi:CRISPR-associated protein Csb2
MFALVFRFPAGRYHATPWGRNVNEADIAWPPEPWRILRALIATWWRKGDHARWKEGDLAALIDALAERPPDYSLPEGVVHAQTRHYMPIPGKTTLVFDGFVRLPADAELVAAWSSLTLSERLFALAADLADGIGYLGRAESWVECEARNDENYRPELNCVIERAGGDGNERDEPDRSEPVRVIAPCSAAGYAAERRRLLAEFNERERTIASGNGKKAPTEKQLAAAQKKAFGHTLEERLVDALMCDTGDYQKFKWTRPPASQDVVYLRNPIGSSPMASRQRDRLPDDRASFTVARFVLAGRPRPRIEDTIRIGELMRLASLSKFDWTTDEVTGRKRPNAPGVVSGRDTDGHVLRDPQHRHAFWLPEDADGDGEIDHIVVAARDGFCAEVRSKLDRVTRLWDAKTKRARDSEGEETEGREEWRLALEGFGKPGDFSNESRLLATSSTWESLTPFLAAGHLKSGGYEAEIRRLTKLRGLPELAKVQYLRHDGTASDDSHERAIGTEIKGRHRRPIHFHRFRSRSGEKQPDALGTFLRLTFAEPVQGPLALGYGSHFGLGLFGAPRKNSNDGAGN